MSRPRQRFVIVGAGAAGTRAALTLAPHEGVEVVLIGDEPCPPYERPPLSKAVLAGAEIAEIAIDRDGLLAAHGVEQIHGVAATAIERMAKVVQLADGRGIAYDKLLLATGRRARQLAQLPVGGPPILTLRNAADALLLREALASARSLLVIGGGLIGLEVAAEANRRGIATHVIEAGRRLMARAVPEAISAAARSHHISRGTDVSLDTALTGFDGGAAKLDDGRTIPADCIVVAIGSTAETGLAARAGLQIDRGIIVDAFLRTSDPAIFAAGDAAEMRTAGAARLFENWTAAEAQGEVAARNMLGESLAFRDASWFWSDQGDFALEGAGGADGPVQVLRSYADGGVVAFVLGADGTLQGVHGAGSRGALRDVRFGRQLIAAGRAISADQLADPDKRLKDLLREDAHQSVGAA